MKNSKNILAVGLLVTSLVTITTAQADGLLSKLFSAKGNASFNTMLSHVPADTAFMFTNKKAIPDDVMDFHIKRSQDAFSAISKMQEENKSKHSKTDAFLKALFDDLGSKVKEGKLDDSGLSLKANSMIYGYQQIPVLRLSISDKEKILKTIKSAEEKSGYKLELSKCGEFDCLKSTKNKDDDMDMALVLLKGQLAASVFPIDKQEAIINHLIGKADPKESFSEKKWDSFLKENDYSGYGDGFADLKKLYQLARPTIAEGIKQDSKSEMTDKEVEACLAVVDDHLDNIPEVIFGTKSLTLKKMDYEFVWKTSTAVSDVLQEIANKTNIAKRSSDPIFDIGLNINFKKLGEALTTYSKFLVKSGETHKCKKITPQDVRKGMGGMMMAMNMGLSQFKSIYFSLNDIELDERMQPKKINALLSVGTDDPAGLIAMVGMMSPKLMGFQVPADGSPVKLPAGAIPSKGVPLPPLSISRTENTLNIMVGNDKPTLKDYKGETPEIMTIGLDGKRYYQIMTNVLKALSKPTKDGKDESLELMNSMGNMMGKIQEEFTADKRGLVVNYHVNY